MEIQQLHMAATMSRPPMWDNRDYLNPLQLDVVDRCLRRMGEPRLESFLSPMDSLSRSFTNKHKKVYFKVKTQGHRRFVSCPTIVIHIRKLHPLHVSLWWRNDDYLWCKIRHAISDHIDKYENIKHICTFVYLYVRDFCCCVCLYAHKPH